MNMSLIGFYLVVNYLIIIYTFIYSFILLFAYLFIYWHFKELNTFTKTSAECVLRT